MADQPGTDVTAESSPAPDFAAHEATQNAIDLGQQPSSDVTPESSPDPSGKQSASTDAKSAASEPAPPDDKKPHNLQTRKEQVTKEVAELQEQLRLRKALRAELDTLAPPAKPAPSQPAKPAEPEWKRYRTHPQAPKVESFDEYEDYVTAMGVFVADQRFAERDHHAQLDAQSRERMTKTQKKIADFSERYHKALEADPDLDSKIDPGLRKLVPAFALKAGEEVRPSNVLLQEVVTSEFSNELMVHFSTPEGQKEWDKLIRLPFEESPAAMIRAFGRIEARFESSGQAAADGKSTAKPVTSAPAPPRTLGGKPPADPDRAGAAVRAGDFSAYAAAADAADLARVRGR